MHQPLSASRARTVAGFALVFNLLGCGAGGGPDLDFE
jgi:hypothetical protein